MTAGHLQVKNGYYYIVLNYTDSKGVRKQPWFSTGLPEKNNKKRAEKMLMEMRRSFVIPDEEGIYGDISPNMLFADYMEVWLEIVRGSVEKTTFLLYIAFQRCSSTVQKQHTDTDFRAVSAALFSFVQVAVFNSNFS